MLQDYAAGDVHKLLAMHGGYLPERAAQQQVMQPVVSSIAYLHAQACQHYLAQNPHCPQHISTIPQSQDTVEVAYSCTREYAQ